MPNGGTPQACQHCQWSVNRDRKRFFGLLWKFDSFCTRHQFHLPLAHFTFCPQFTIDDQPAHIITEENITAENMYIWVETPHRPGGQAQVPIYHHDYEVLAPLKVYATMTEKQILAASRTLYDKHSPPE